MTNFERIKNMTPADFARFVATSETDYLNQVITLYPTRKTIYRVTFGQFEKWLELDTPEAWEVEQ